MRSALRSAKPAPPPVRPGVAALPHSRIREVYTQIHAVPDLIPLWFGEPDMPTPAFINDAATRALAAGHTFYTPNRGIPELRQALSDYLTRHYETPVPVERICVTPSGMGAIMLVLQSLIDVGDEIVAISPVWSNSFRAVQMLGGATRMVELQRAPGGSGGWRLDLDRLFDSVTEKTRAILVTSPSNPTGWVMTEEEQRRVLEFTRARGIWLLADEVYDRLVFEQARAPSFLRLAEPDDLVVVFNSFSKSWAMTGWRLGWTVSMPGLVPILEKLNEINQTGAATFIQHAGVTAVREGEPFVQAQLERYRANRDLVIQRLAGQMVDRKVLLFAAEPLTAVARRWRGQIAENSKASAQTDELPEMNHNAIAGIERPEALITRSFVLFLNSGLYHPRNAARMQWTRAHFMHSGYNCDAVAAAGSGRLAQMLSVLHFGDYVSYYLAIANGVDPTPIDVLLRLKAHMAKS